MTGAVQHRSLRPSMFRGAAALVLACFLAFPSAAAITSNGASTSNATVGLAPTLSWNHEVFAGDDRVLFVGLSMELGQSSTVTYGGAPLTLAGRYTGTSSHTIEIWYRANPPVGDATILATFDTSREVIGGASTFNGVDPTTPTSGFLGASTDSDSPSVTITSAVGELVLDTLFVDINSFTATPEASQTERWNLKNGRHGAGSTEPGAASVEMSWTLSDADEWTLAGLSIKPVVGLSISGTVFEDANFAGTAAAYDGGASDKALQGVDVELYDGGTDAYITSTTTMADGSYRFSGLVDGSFKVRVRSSTLGSGTAAPKGGLNACVPATCATPLPEMTWGNGGALYGGQSATVDDTATGDNGGPGDTYLPVTVSGANVGGVDFGFAYNLIVNTLDDINADNVRSVQGGLRQFIKNANAIGTAGATTANTSQFRMQVPANQTSGADTWWRIVPAATMTSLADGGTVLDGTTQTTNGGNVNSLGPEVELHGAGAAIDGLDVSSAGNVVRGLILNGFSDAFKSAIRMIGVTVTGNTIAENYIGTDHAAAAAVSNYYGVRMVTGPSSNTIGGSTAADRNVISGNAEVGILVSGATSTGNLIKGNYIGTDRQGTASVPNDLGIDISSNASGTVVGGSSPNDTNVISGNSGEGIYVEGGDNSVIQGNIIGADKTGDAALPNRRGIWLASAAVGNLVGGTTADLRNQISGNGFNGIVIGQTGTQSNTVVGNWIGTDSTGIGPLPNIEHGIHLQFDASNNTIGGTAGGEPNVIAFNTGDGVFADQSGTDGNRISGNAIFENDGLGIDLAPDGPGTGTGANNDKAAPTIVTLTSTGSGFTGVITVTAGDTLELYRVDNAAAPTVTEDASGSGEGYLYLGSCVDNGACTGPHLSAGPDTDPLAGSIQVMLLPSGVSDGDSVTGTSTDASGNTSEFAANVPALFLADLEIVKSDSPDPAPESGPLVYTLVVTNHGPDTATNVTLTDVLPAGTTFQSATPSQGTCSGTGPVSCNFGAILNGGTASVEILIVTGTAGMITNNASVVSDQVDPAAANDADSEDTTVVAGGSTDVPLTQYTRFHGFVDSTSTGGTLRTQDNATDACAVGAGDSETLAGIPGGATVVGAYLYWAGSGVSVDNVVTFDGSPVTADRTFQAQLVLGATNYDFFGGFEDVTTQVAAKGNGSYSFGGLTVDTGNPFCSAKAVLAGWSLLVVYQDNGLTGKTLVIYDGFDLERNGSSSYVLTGIWAADPPEAKTTYVLWEGDPDLSGASEKLEFNATPLSDATNPVDNVYNSTINSVGSTMSYGVDVDTFDVSSLITKGDTIANTEVFAGPDLVILNAVLLQVKSNVIVGSVFEDVNYGGGQGRNLATATTAAPAFGVGRPGAVVELYDTAGNFLRTTTTNLDGEYGFAGLIDGNYRVRSVNGTVVSSRPGATGSEWPVQTYRTDASSGTVVAVTNEIGGNDPTAQDSPANLATANLSTLTAQTVTPVMITTGVAVPNVDFGYNFDTIVNTNDNGQGSLRQFILNSNDLTNADLDQDDAPVGVSAVTKNAGDEHSIFMIPATELAATIDGGGGTVILIQPSTGLDAITDSNTVMDGRTQTALTGDTNSALAEVTTGPEVIIDLRGTVAADVLTVRGDDTIVDSLGLTGAPGVGRDGIDAASLSGAEFRNNTIFDNGAHGAYFGAVTGSNVTNNVIRDNGVAEATADGILLTSVSNGNTISGNQIVANAGFGIEMAPPGPNGSNTITANLIKGNGTSASDENAGIKVDASDDNSITLNTITENAGDGIVITSGDFGNLVSQNSIFNNGELGMDLSLDSSNDGDGVTPNDDPDMAGGGNNRQNFPVITSAGWNGVNTVVKGTLTSTPGATFDIEIFSGGVCNGDVGGSPQVDAFGEGETYRTTANVTDGDSDGVVTFSANVPVDLTGQQVTATATDTSNDDTSEFGPCYSSASLSIIKRAFQIDGTPIASGSTLPAGMPVKFMLYVSNAGGLVSDVSLQDVLNPLFVYTPGSIRYDNSVAACAGASCTPVEEAAIFAAADSGTVGTDAVNGDPVSFSGVTLDLGDANAANGQLDLAPGKVWAVVFTVRMQ